MLGMLHLKLRSKATAGPEELQALEGTRHALQHELLRCSTGAVDVLESEAQGPIRRLPVREFAPIIDGRMLRFADHAWLDVDPTGAPQQ